MSSIFNTDLLFTNPPYNGNYVIPGGYRYYWSWDAVVLYGAGVNFSDQQHNNNRGPNYFSYRIKHIRLHGVVRLGLVGDYPNKEFKLTLVLYKCPAKYENGNLVPIHTKGFINLENYILYSDPECILSWGVFPELYRDTIQHGVASFDVSLSCKKPFILGPNELICCNCLVDRAEQQYYYSPYYGRPCINAKVVFDIN